MCYEILFNFIAIQIYNCLKSKCRQKFTTEMTKSMQVENKFKMPLTTAPGSAVPAPADDVGPSGGGHRVPNGIPPLSPYPHRIEIELFYSTPLLFPPSPLSGFCVSNQSIHRIRRSIKMFHGCSERDQCLIFPYEISRISQFLF